MEEQTRAELLLEWVAEQAEWAGPALFVLVFLEALAFVGFFVPLGPVMIGVGVLVGAGALNFMNVAIGAAAGSVLGGSVAFLVGRYFKDHLRKIRPFRTRPHLMARAEVFFDRHGGKGILFGRYTKPLRLMLPMVAGIAGMPVKRFMAMNLIAGILWAPLYLIAGMGLTRAYRWASGTPLRVAVVLAGVALLITSIVLVTRRLRRQRSATS
jgi:membrane protein DedA with SNARE-associated domain